MATTRMPARILLLLHGLALILLINSGAWAGYCDGDWLSVGRVTRFTPGPCLGISGIGATQNPQKTIYIIDRSDMINTYLRFPGQGGARGNLAYAEELNLESGSQRPLNVLTNTFCSSGQYLPDGTFVSVGGDDAGQADGTLGNGTYSIRSLRPGKAFKLEQKMVSQRWYPTTHPLADGRVIVVGGSLVGLDLNFRQQNNPTLEYFPRRDGEGQYDLPLLAQTLPYNLYPLVHLLPSGKVFIFSGNSYVLWDTQRNVQVGDPVALNVKDQAGDTVFFCYPLTATSALFPLSAINNYVAEIMICGGGSSRAKNRRGREGDPTVQAHQSCWRIQPEAPRPQWYEAVMSAPRIMPQAVLLPDASVLIMNGARTGYAGIPDYTTSPVLTPDQFDTRRKRWKGIPLAASKIPRLYHGSAFLLHDASVFVSGGNPNKGIRQRGRPGDTRFQSEIFSPPYLSGGSFPKITRSPANINVGGAPFTITVQGPANANAAAFSVVLCYPGFSTHSANHGMRNVELEVVSVTGRGPYDISLKSPPSKNVAPPTWYWLFVLINGIPNRDGITLYINQ